MMKFLKERIETSNIMRRTFFLQAVMAMLLLFPISAMAATTDTVYDDAGLLSEAEMNELDRSITGYEDYTGWDIFAVTTNDAEGKTSTEYADDFYDTHTEAESGIVVLVDMDNREVTISTAGDAIYYLTDDRIDDILDSSYSFASDGDYAGCIKSCLDLAIHDYDLGIPSNQYTYDVETGKVVRHRSLTFVEILIALAIAAAVWAAVFFGIIGKYRLKFGTYQYDYHGFGNVKLKNQQDQFVNQMVTHRRIETNNGGGGGNSSGRSSVHTSSGGTSHGGGSHKF